MSDTEKAISVQEMHAFYEAHPYRFKNVTRTAHILLRSETLANELMARIRAGEDFGTLAEAYSECPSNTTHAVKGGDQGYVPWGVGDADYMAAVSAMKEIGEVTGPVKSRFGYHLIKLLDVKPQMEFEEAADSIRFAIQNNVR